MGQSVSPGRNHDFNMEETMTTQSLTKVARVLSDAWHRLSSQFTMAGPTLRGDEQTELGHVTAEMHVTPAELRALAATGPAEAELLYRRLGILGLSPSKIGPATLDTLEQRCGGCAGKAQCTHDFERNIASRWPRYCPNEDMLQDLSRKAGNGK